ncbi:YqaJ viral recombinase family protein [Pirellulaceae bacterium SH449]
MSIATFDRAAWLEERKSSIGASDVAAILGLNPWASAWDVWADKRGLIEDWEGNEATELGTRFETVILDIAEQKIGELIRNKRIKHPSLPIASTCDAISWNTQEPVEAKTTGLVGPVYGEWGDEGTDVVPDAYSIQVHTQLLCSDPSVQLGHLFGLVPGRGVVHYQIPRSDKLCEQLGNILADWWERHIVQGVEPSRDKASFDVVKRLKKVPNKVVVFPESVDRILERFETLKAIAKRREKQVEQLQTALLLELGDAEEGVLLSGKSINYYEQHVKGYYREPTSFRVFRVSKPKRGKR